MKLFKLLLIVIIITMGISCGKSEKAEQIFTYRFIKYNFVQLENKIQNTNSNLIKIKYPKIIYGVDFKKLNKLNQLIENIVKDKLGIKKEEKLIDFIKNFSKTYSKMPNGDNLIKINLNCEFIYENKDFLTLKINIMSNLKNGEKQILNYFTTIDKNNIKTVKIKELIEENKYSEFQKYVFAQFKEIEQITDDKQLRERGFKFQSNNFPLSNNFGVNKKGFIFYYNPSTISVNKNGYFQLDIDFDKLASFLNKKSRELLIQ